MSIEVRGKIIETDEEGFLLNPNDWSEEVAEKIAEREGIKLDDVKWALIRYFREYYEEHQTHPTMHKLLLTEGKLHGDHFKDTKLYRDFLYETFPKGPIQTLCKLAGLPKPAEEVEAG